MELLSYDEHFEDYKFKQNSIDFESESKYPRVWMVTHALGPCHTTGNFHEPMAQIGRATLPLTTQAALWGEAWWRVQEFRPSELPGDSHRKPMESGGGHPMAHRDRPLPPSLAKYPCLVVVNDEELYAAHVVALARLGWSGYSEPTCFPSLHGEIACRPSGKGLRKKRFQQILKTTFKTWTISHSHTNGADELIIH